MVRAEKLVAPTKLSTPRISQSTHCEFGNVERVRHPHTGCEEELQKRGISTLGQNMTAGNGASNFSFSGQPLEVNPLK